MTKKKEEFITAYKGLGKNFQCRGYQYEVGKEYTHTGKVRACEGGFHACEYPLDIYKYYPLDLETRYAVVEMGGETHKESDKICSSVIKIKAEIKFADIIKASVDWHFNGWFKKAKQDKEVSSGNYSKLAASGDDSKLAASGYGSKLAASGGGSNVIVSAERNIMVKGSKGTLICLTHYVDNKPVKFVTGQIGKNKLKADTWYELDSNGKFVEA